MAEREHPENFLDKGQSTMPKVICNKASECSHVHCVWKKACPNTEMLNAHCDYHGGSVSIKEIELLPEDNPNSKFRRSKHGF